MSSKIPAHLLQNVFLDPEDPDCLNKIFAKSPKAHQAVLRMIKAKRKL